MKRQRGATRMPPRIGTVLETSLYVDDLQRSVNFYERTLGFKPVESESTRMRTLDVTPDQVLLLFKKGGSVKATVTPFGTIPPTDGDGQLHVAFAIPKEQFDEWRVYLQEKSVEVESTVKWPEGGQSLYFRDPDGHLIELKSSNWYGQELDWR